MKQLPLAAVATLLLSGAAHAASVQCNPKDNTARILGSASPNDTAPDWKMGYVGLDMVFFVKRTVDAETGKYFQGDLTKHGGMLGRNLFILPREWDCGS